MAFDRGLVAFQASDYEAACEHFRRSYKLDPLAGVLFTWATCEVRAGRIATGYALYEDFLAIVQALPQEKREIHADRLLVVEREMQAIEGDVPRLRVEVHADGLQSYTLKVGGKVLGPQDVGIRKPHDPGSLTVTLTSDGAVVEERRISLRKGDDVILTLGLPVSRPQPSPSQKIDTLRPSPWIYATGAIALTGISVGSVFGLMAIEAESKLRCQDSRCEDTLAVSDARAAKSKALVSTVSFAVGAVALSATVALIVIPLTKRTSNSDLAVSIRPGGVDFQGQF